MITQLSKGFLMYNSGANTQILNTTEDYRIVGFFVWDTSFDLLFRVAFNVKVAETP